MKIAYICDINLNERGAARNHVVEIVKNLNLLGNKVEVFCHLFKRSKEEQGIKFHRIWIPPIKISLIRSILFNFVSIFSFLISSFKFKPEIIYSRNSISFISPVICSKIKKVPLVIEVNGAVEELLKSWNACRLVIYFSGLIERISLNQASKVICASQQLKNYICKKYNLEDSKVTYLENGVDTKMFKPLKNKTCLNKLKLDRNLFYIGYVGGLSKWQGLDYLILSAEKVIKTTQNCRFLIVGEGPERVSLEKLVHDKELDKYFIFLGSVPHSEIPFYINSFNIGVIYLTRLNEGRYGTPFKLYEYLACGCPTVTSNISDVTRIFKDGVVFAKAEDPTDLSLKIINLINSPPYRKKLAKKGRAFILNGHSWIDVAKRTQIILKECLCGKI